MSRKLGDRKKVESVKVDGRWDVLVCTPAYDGKVDSAFSQALAEAAFCSPLYQVKMNASVMSNGAFIDLARNTFVKIFLTDFPEATHLFFIDADVHFPAKAFIGLIRSGLPICAGVYRRRQDPESYPVKFAEDESGGMIVEDDWLMAERVPTGFLCIAREVLEEMAAEAEEIITDNPWSPMPKLFYTKLEDSKFIGEDFAFCDDYVKKYGKYIPVWPNIDFMHGGFKGNLSDYVEKQIEGNKEENAA